MASKNVPRADDGNASSAGEAAVSRADGAAIDKETDISKKRDSRPIGGNLSPPILRLLPRFVCKRTVVELERLLVKAIAGEVVGIAYSAAVGRNFSVNVIGTFADDPTFARGAVAALDDELRYLMQEAADREPLQ